MTESTNTTVNNSTHISALRYATVIILRTVYIHNYDSLFRTDLHTYFEK